MPFSLAARVPVPALGVELQTWTHPCGAVHHHLACADDHRAFAVAVRTPPGDSTGLPHILEHTVLCGSRRYPVRDPFFNMLRRSLQTFMNAMTYPDFTAYPFATQVAKDWHNLLGVYLDAVFAPNLDPRDFAQEGHRLAPTPDGSWQRQGVVFNEMKGAMDDSEAQVEAAVARALFPDTIFAHNSGGEPSDIPLLSHADLVAFHRRCYRPANAVFLSYGNLDPVEVHTAVDGYLADPGAALPPPAAQPPLAAPQHLTVAVPCSDGQDPEDVSSCGITWVLGDIADLDGVLDAELLDRLLLGHAGAPLRRALEGCGLGRSIGGSGFGTGYRNGQFTLELDGVHPDDHGKVEPLILEALAAVVRDGVPASDLDAALHQVELARREIRGDSFPYGLGLCFRLIAPWNLGVDPLPFLDQGPAVERLNARARTPGWLQDRVSRLLLANPHRATVGAIPDAQWHARRQAAEDAQTAAAVAALDPAGIAALTTAAAELAARQATRDDASILPELTLADIPGERRWVSGTPDEAEPRLTVFRAGTNGLLHLLAAVPLPELSADELDLLPLIGPAVSGLGVGTRDYAAWSAHLAGVCGSLWAWTDVAADSATPGAVRALLMAEVKGLASRAESFVPLLAEALGNLRADEHERLAELLDQSLSRFQDRITSEGSRMAARAASRGFGGAVALSHRSGGLGRLAWLRRTVAGDTRPIGARLAALLRSIASLDASLAVIGDATDQPRIRALARSAWPGRGTAPAFRAPQAAQVAPTAFTTATEVGYHALAFQTVPLTHPDAAPLAIAGELLTHQQLHPRLRERGGAYGGGAGYQGGTATFTLTSYRDPRAAATYADMRESLAWLADYPGDERTLKEAVLAVIANLDAPGSPAGECRSRFSAEAKGSGPAVLNAYRSAVLAVTPEAIRAAARRHLPADGGTAASVCSAETAKSLGWDAVAI